LTPKELYALWAPADSIWSPWVLPVPFAQLDCTAARKSSDSHHFHLAWLAHEKPQDVALVVDLPGEAAIRFGLAVLKLGFRPVPVIDGSPGPAGASNLIGAGPSHSTVDMRGLLRALCQGAEELREYTLAAEAPPAFLLDAGRMENAAADLETAYDNRWKAFPQDFPSGRFLLDQRIRRVVLLHGRYLKQPQDDLAHVLLRWQESGIVIESKFAWNEAAPEPITVHRPSWFRVVWYRAIAMLGLRRSDTGGFGDFLRSIGGGG
jgi:hypothetical protein